MSLYITGKEAMMLLTISTRQRLNQLVREKGIEFKNTGAGLPNVYLKSDIERCIKPKTTSIKIKPSIKTPTVPKRKKKTKAEVEKEIDTTQVNITEKKERIKKAKELKPKELKIEEPQPEEYNPPLKPPPKNDDGTFTPLNPIGQAEFLRVEKELQENGTLVHVDRSILIAYAISYQRFINATTMSAMEDDVNMDAFGKQTMHVQFQIADKALSQMMKLSASMGIGVRNRIGLDIKKEKKESIFDVINADKDEF